MQSKTQIHWHGLDRSEAMEALILDKVAALDRLDTTLIVAKVTVELPHRHQAHGKLFHVKVQLDYPGHEIVVSHDPSPKKSEQTHEDVGVAIRDAFAIAKRQVKDWVEKRRDGRRAAQ